MDIKIHQKKTKKMVNNMYENMDKIINCIDEGNYFIVTSHVNPDGDNIGSTLAMYYYLKSLDKDVYYVLDDDTPINLKFLLKDIEILRDELGKPIVNTYNNLSEICIKYNIKEIYKTNRGSKYR